MSDQSQSTPCYKKNYLVSVVSNINFLDEIKGLDEKILPPSVQSVIKDQYPLYEPSTGISQGVYIGNNSITTKKEEFHNWVYHGKDREKTLTLNKQSLNVTLRQYNDYTHFKRDVVNPINAIKTIDEGRYIGRTGLRFVNIFNIIESIDDVAKYFSPMMRGPFSGIPNIDECSRSILITEYTHEDIKVRIQSGIYNPDYPARMKRLDFAVDIEAYIDTPHVFGEIGDVIDKLHGKIQSHFESAITEEMRAKLNE